MRQLDKDTLEEKYDRKVKINVNKQNYNTDTLIKEQPLSIEHGFELKEDEDQSGKPITIDFRGIKYFTDFHIHAPEAKVRIEHFDCSTDGDGILAWIKKDFMDDNQITLYWNEPSKEEVFMQELTGVERISTPSTRKKREKDGR